MMLDPVSTEAPVTEFRQRLADYREDMPEGHVVLAKYLLDRPGDAAFLTAYQLAQETDTSSSTVVRYVQAMGYSGFPAFQKAAQDDYRENFGVRLDTNGDEPPQTKEHARTVKYAEERIAVDRERWSQMMEDPGVRMVKDEAQEAIEEAANLDPQEWLDVARQVRRLGKRRGMTEPRGLLITLAAICLRFASQLPREGSRGGDHRD